MRATLLLPTLGLLSAGAIAAVGQGLAYRPVPGWPSGGAHAPGYGTAAVSATAVDRAGRIYVFQRAAEALLLFGADGAFLKTVPVGRFASAHGCRVDPEGNLWLTDNGDHRVLKLSPEGKTLASFGVQGQPGEVAFAPNGDVYVSDGYGNSRVVRFSHDGKYLGAWGKKGTGEGEFNLPHAVVVDRRGRVYVADRENARIQVFTPEGKFITQWRDTGHPYGLYLTPDERLFVTDGIAHTLSLFDLNGKRLGQYGMPGKGPGEFDLPHLLTVDGEGAVYVCEINGKRIQKLIRQ
ncbi:MAG: hypothetical protein K0Q72_4896 [Armatimonadetes bacterium]|nr:hypothetical protein [Armatimonadota bacterium]